MYDELDNWRTPMLDLTMECFILKTWKLTKDKDYLVPDEDLWRVDMTLEVLDALHRI